MDIANGQVLQFFWKRITVLVTEHDDDKVVLVFLQDF
jgi:hypothetical protein